MNRPLFESYHKKYLLIKKKYKKYFQFNDAENVEETVPLKLIYVVIVHLMLLVDHNHLMNGYNPHSFVSVQGDRKHIEMPMMMNHFYHALIYSTKNFFDISNTKLNIHLYINKRNIKDLR
jgi:hypothetical protein